MKILSFSFVVFLVLATSLRARAQVSEKPRSNFKAMKKIINNQAKMLKKIEKDRSKNVNLGAQVKMVGDKYFDKISSQDYNWNSYSSLSLLPRYQKDNLEFHAKIDFRFDQANVARRDVRLHESYFTFVNENFTTSAGRIRLNYSSSRVLNPTQIFGAIDYYDLIDSENLGDWMVKFDFAKSNINYSLIIWPVFTPHNILDTRSRWLNFTGPAVDILAPGTKLRYEISTDLYPKTPAVGLMSKWSGEDLNAMIFYQHGYDRLPTDVFQVIGSPNVFNNEVFAVVTPYYDLKHHVGLNLEGQFNQVRATTEILYGHPYKSTHPYDSSLTGPRDIIGVMGVELPTNSWRFLLEYSFRKILHDGNVNVFNRQFNNSSYDQLVPSGIRNGYTNNIIPAISRTITDDIDAYIGAIYNIKDHSSVVRFQTTVRWSDNLNSVLSVDSISGEAQKSFWGIYKKNDRVKLALNMEI